MTIDVLSSPVSCHVVVLLTLFKPVCTLTLTVVIVPVSGLATLVVVVVVLVPLLVPLLVAAVTVSISGTVIAVVAVIVAVVVPVPPVVTVLVVLAALVGRTAGFLLRRGRLVFLDLWCRLNSSWLTRPLGH